MVVEETRSLTGIAVAAVALVAGVLTWICVGWFGDQSLLTAMVAVVLVEVCLASFGMIAMLLAERMSVSMMNAERRPAPPVPVRRKPEPVWFRLPDPVPGAAQGRPSAEPESLPPTIAFPSLDRQRSDDDVWQPGRAA